MVCKGGVMLCEVGSVRMLATSGSCCCCCWKFCPAQRGWGYHCSLGSSGAGWGGWGLLIVRKCCWLLR